MPTQKKITHKGVMQMKIKSIQLTSATALDLDLTLTAPICVFRGRFSDLALDLIRETIGDYNTQNNPDRVDDGRFVTHADVEMDGKNYSVCYIRNADFMGDNRLAVNFEPDSVRFSEDDTREFVDKCDKDEHCPFFIYDYFDRLDEAEDITDTLDQLSSFRRQVFISVCANYPVRKMKHAKVQIINMEDDNDEN